MKHYTQEQLDQYKHGDMSIIGKLTCKMHLCFCQKCSDQLRTISEDDSFMSELKNAVKTFDVPPDEKELKTLCSIFKDDTIGHSTSA
jgi:hypothetical protein